MKKLNILFLGGSKRVSLAERFIRAGIKNNLRVKVFSYELDQKVPFSSIGEVIIGLKWNDKKIYLDLKKLIISKNISIVIANVDMATIVLSKLKKKFSNLNIISSDEKICQLLFDKMLTHTECKKLEIKSIPLSNNQFPMYIKLRKGSASKNNFLIKNKASYNFFLKNNYEKKYIKQKYINGIEYSVDAYVSKNKDFIGAVPRIRETIVNGESSKTVVVKDNEITNKTKEIVSKLNLIGPLTIQFIRKGNNLYFLEINPRFGGGVIASIEAGFDIPDIMIKDYLNLRLIKLKKYKELIMTRSYRDTFHDTKK